MDHKSLMMETRRWRLLFSVICFALLFSIECSRRPMPNVIVVTIDTLRADRLGCYGYPKPTSPRIDAFASRAILFESAFSQSPQTLPSHTSIFTGLHPRHHKSITHESPVDEKLKTLAEILKRRGYVTGAFVSSHVLESRLNLTQGFDTYWEIQKIYDPEGRRKAQEREIDFTTEAVLGWLRQHKQDRFMLWVHWFHPHRPYNPPPRYRQMFAGDYSGTASSEPEFMADVWRRKIELSQADVDFLRGCYDGEVAFADEQFGRLLDEIQAMGLADETMIILTSDHGEILYEHEYYFGHDIALYEECIAVPLLIHGPSVFSDHKRISQPVELIDIMPTLLDFLGIRQPKRIDGRSLVPLVTGKDSQPREYFFSETFPFPEKGFPHHAVRTQTAKLVWRQTSKGIVKEFYDLASDPLEENNTYSPDNRTAAHLDSVLASWIEPEGLLPAPIPTAVEAGRLRILKSLGYLD